MEEFNYNEINKRNIAPHLLKSYGIDIEKAETKKKAMTTVNTPGKETAMSTKEMEKGGENTDDAMYMAEGDEHQQAKMSKVMGEFKSGKLKTPDGKQVTDQKQAIAIAYSEAGLSKSNKMSKAFDVLGVDYIEKAEGSHGGKVIGHTKSGKPIYESSSHPLKSALHSHLENYSSPGEHWNNGEVEKEKNKLIEAHPKHKKHIEEAHEHIGHISNNVSDLESGNDEDDHAHDKLERDTDKLYNKTKSKIDKYHYKD